MLINCLIMRKHAFWAAITLPLLTPVAWGCSLGLEPHNAYQRQESGVVYNRIDPYEEKTPTLIARLPEVNYHRLRRLPDLAKAQDKQSEWSFEEPLTNLATDFISEGENADQPYFSYHSDGRHILWAGHILHNPTGAPPVDTATFRVFGRFAADKHSLYFDGERTEDNPGVEMTTLSSVNSPWSVNFNAPELATVLRDRQHLYLRGHRANNPGSFTVVAQKPWDQRGKFYAIYPCTTSPYGPWDTLARTDTQMFINGRLLDADAASFSIVRWIPGSVLIYRDKNGVKRQPLMEPNTLPPKHALGSKDCSANFNMLEDRVTWRKGWQGDDCQIETLPGLDPEQFHPLNHNVAQYQDRLYTVKKTEFGERYLDVITLDDPNLTINERFSAGKHHGYLLSNDRRLEIFDNDGKLEVFESSGPLVLLNNGYARDDRYVYVHTGTQLYRYVTAWSQYAHVEGGLLVTLEGTYYRDVFEPRDKLHKEKTPTGALPGLDPAQSHAITENVTQYQDRLYVNKLTFFGEKVQEIISMDTSIPKIADRLIASQSHGYFIRNDGVQVFATAGALHLNDDRTAYDDRYVYTWSGNQLYRRASRCPAHSYFTREHSDINSVGLTLVQACQG